MSSAFGAVTGNVRETTVSALLGTSSRTSYIAVWCIILIKTPLSDAAIHINRSKIRTICISGIINQGGIKDIEDTLSASLTTRCTSCWLEPSRMI